jgi:hypothetical protein
MQEKPWRYSEQFSDANFDISPTGIGMDFLDNITFCFYSLQIRLMVTLSRAFLWIFKPVPPSLEVNLGEKSRIDIERFSISKFNFDRSLIDVIGMYGSPRFALACYDRD